MPLAVLFSRASAGIEAPLVTIEVHISNGLPGFSMVGLPETAVKESKDRVRSAILNSQFEFPPRRITVNLAPADLPKEGGRFDLPIALGILAASGQIPPENLATYEFTGELALTGDLRGISGALPFAMATRKAKRTLLLPFINIEEAALSRQLTILPAKHLLEVCAHLLGKEALPSFQKNLCQPTVSYPLDLKQVRGQYHAKRALEIAAAGQHSLLMCGQPGTGKTMLASRLPGILPELTEEEALEIASIYSISSRKFDYKQWGIRPFRAPHHTASSVALVGGGSPPKPGEISLAHQGVLFLDELPEFNRNVLEALREPLESGHVTISRASFQTQFPAKFQLIMAMNPCPCGYWGDKNGRCHCLTQQVQRYQNKISGPFLDRIDLYVDVPALPKEVLASSKHISESSEIVRKRVLEARAKQINRINKVNSSLTSHEIDHACILELEARKFLEDAIEKLNLSARAYHRIIKVARTIADLENSENIILNHVAEAISYRRIKC